MNFKPVRNLMNQQNLDSFKKIIRKSADEAPQYLKQFKENHQAILYDKLTNLNKWYTKIIGLDEVKYFQDKVITIQDRLLEIQEKRREIGKQLAEIRQKSVAMQDQIHKVKRQDDMDKFLDLMKEETEILKLEQTISRTFQDFDRTERELFTAFTNAIRDSHEKQRAQMEYTKYFGLILGIAGSFLTFVYSTIRKHDLKRFIETSLQNVNVNYTLDSTVLHRLNQSNKETQNEIAIVRDQVKQLVHNIYNKDNSQTLAAYEDVDNRGKSLMWIGGGIILFVLFLKIVGS